MKVRCAVCEKFYLVRLTKNLLTLSIRIEFSVCPHCTAPRNPAYLKLYRDAWWCPVCVLPAPWVRKKNNAWCEACYFVVYRRQVALKRRVL